MTANVASTIHIRPARASDIEGILRLQYACYPTLSKIAQWRENHLLAHQRVFAPGQLVAADGDRILGLGFSFITRSAIALRPHSFHAITARGTFANHDPAGDTLYGAEIMVHPDARRRGIATRIYRARFLLAQRLGLRYFVAGGRLPGYAALKDRMDARTYVERVLGGTLTDRVLSAQLKNGLRVEGLLPDYLTDPNSANYATLLVWENPLLKGSAPTGGEPLRPNAAPRVP